MAQVLLVNPSARKGAKKGAVKMATRKKPRTAAQKRATAKLVAMNKARRSGKSSSSRPARKRTRTTKRTRRSNPVETIMSNPKRRRRASPKRRRSSKSAATGAGRVLRYRRRNPVGGLGEFVSGQLIPSAIGGGGALLLDVALAVLPIPATLKVGAMAPLVRIAGAVGIGALAGMVTNRKTANQIAAGALTVTMYQITRGLLAKMLPPGTIPGLSGEYDLGYINSGMMVGGYEDGMGEYVSDGPALLTDGSMGEYVSGDEGVGEYDGVSGWETGVYR